MSTIARKYTFADLGEARADRWMEDGTALWNFINTNVQDVDGSRAFTTAPVLAGGDPADGNHACTTTYVNTKVRLKRTFSTDLNYPTPSGNVWFIQGGTAAVTLSGTDEETIVVPFKYLFTRNPMVFYTMLQDEGGIEAVDWNLGGRTASNFTIRGRWASGWLTSAHTAYISYLAMGWRAVDWNNELDVQND